MTGQSLTSLVSTSMKEFATQTSIAGVGHAVKAKSWIRVFYWLSIFVVCLYYTISGIINVVQDYYTYPFVTNTEMAHSNSLEFPAVTVCNHNRVNCVNVMLETLRIKQAIALGVNKNSTLELLEQIYTKTGCGDQICQQVVEMFPTERFPMQNGVLGEVDYALLNVRQLE